MATTDSSLGALRARLQAAYRQHGNAEATARALDLPVEAVRRVLAGKGLRGENYARFVAALGLQSVADTPHTGRAHSAGFHVKPPASATGAAMADTVLAGVGPVAHLVRQGQAEQAAWVLEFAARLLEAGARQLRQGVEQAAILETVEAAERARPPAVTRARARPA